MNNDGFGQVGAGPSDRRLVGEDLQHYAQDSKPVGKFKAKVSERESGGPMKEHIKEHKPMHHHLEHEKHRHEESMKHHKHHLEKHHERHFDSQYGHDTHKY